MQEIDRTRRVSAMLTRELAELIRREMNDPRINNVSVNAVKISRDLKHATVYVSAIDGNEFPRPESPGGDKGGHKKSKNNRQPQTVEELLNNASGFLRHLLSQTVELRVMPTLRFIYDNSIERGVEMSTLIESLKSKSTDDPR